MKISFANEQSLKIISEFERDNFCGEAYSYDMLKEMLVDNYKLKDNDNIFAIFNDDEVIGYVIFHIADDFTDIFKIYIRENDRRKGYAKDFIVHIESLAKRYNSKKIMVEVRSKNETAINFYFNLGFQKVSTRNDYYKNPVDDAYILEKKLEV